MSHRPQRIGITVGDPAGIGPEVVSAALRAGGLPDAEFTVYGDLEAVERAGGRQTREDGEHSGLGIMHQHFRLIAGPRINPRQGLNIDVT